MAVLFFFLKSFPVLFSIAAKKLKDDFMFGTILAKH
jgi:hypothetical protein